MAASATRELSVSFQNIALMWSLWFQVDDRRTGIRRANVEHKWVQNSSLLVFVLLGSSRQKFHSYDNVKIANRVPTDFH